MGVQIEDKKALWGSLELTMAMILAGSSVVAAKMLTGQYSFSFIGFMSSLFAFLTLSPFQARKLYQLKEVSKRGWMNLGLQALTGIVLFRLFTLWGLRYSQGISAAVISSLGPGIFTLSAVFLLKEKPGRRGFFSLLLALGGLLLFQGAQLREFSIQGKQALGYALLLIAMLSESLLSYFRKKAQVPLPASLNAWVLCGISTLVFAIPMALQGAWPSHIPLRDWIILYYYGGAATALAYILWGRAALKLPLWQIGICTMAMPLSSFFLSVLILQEPPNWYHYGALFLGILAMSLGITRRKVLDSKKES